MKQAPKGPDCYAIVAFRHQGAAAAALAALHGCAIPELTLKALKLREWREDRPAAKAASWWRGEPGPPQHPRQQRQRHGGWAAEDEEPRWRPPGGGGGGGAEVPLAEGWGEGSFAEEEEYTDDEDDPTVEL